MTQVADHDWAAIYAVVMQGLDDYDPPDDTDRRLSTGQREQIAETVTDHLAASLTRGALRERASSGVRRTASGEGVRP